jgi:hypothetical protein
MSEKKTFRAGNLSLERFQLPLCRRCRFTVLSARSDLRAELRSSLWP